MSLAQMFLPELEHELATTRKCIERAKNDQLGWKPHAKSMSLGQLVSHLAEIPGWVDFTLQTAELDLQPPGGDPYKPVYFETVEEALAAFDKGCEDAKAALAKTSDAALAENWSMLFGGHVIFTMPKAAVMRTWVINHMVHHRGQLSVYLRLLDIPVPSIYGPTADEGQM